MLNKAHDAATNKGAAITTKRVSIINDPFEIFKITTLFIVVQSLIILNKYFLLNSY